MKTFCHPCNIIACLLVLVFHSLPDAADLLPPNPCANQYFDERLMDALSSVTLEHREAIWVACDDPGSSVPLAGIPAPVIPGFEKTVKAFLRPEWIPEDMGSQLGAMRIRFPSIPPCEIGYFVMRYRRNGYNIQIRENGISLSLLISPLSSSNSYPDNPGGYIRSMAGLFLNMPRDTLDACRIEVSEKESNSVTLFHGLMISRHAQRPAKDWRDRMYVWTDGVSVHFNLLEIGISENDVKEPQAQPGIPKRF